MGDRFRPIVSTGVIGLFSLQSRDPVDAEMAQGRGDIDRRWATVALDLGPGLFEDIGDIDG